MVTHAFGFGLTFVAVIITTVFRYSDEGMNCAANDTEILLDQGDCDPITFKYSDHDTIIEDMLIALCIVLCCMKVWLLFMMKVSGSIISLN